MELWVRSQNRTRLVKAEHIYYCKNEFTNNELKHYICSIGAYDLGKYKTEERALEVLDEIQDLLETREVSQMVYNMPEN